MGERTVTDAGEFPEPEEATQSLEADGEQPSDAPPQERLSELETELAAAKDQALRAMAEADNARRRASRDVENAHKFALEKFAGDLLPVADSLEKAVDAAEAVDGADAIAEGVRLSLKLFVDTLARFGIEQIDPVGEPFDPQKHEAMAMVPNDSMEANSVMEVMQRGYLLNGRLVRAAMVVVSQGPQGDGA